MRMRTLLFSVSLYAPMLAAQDHQHQHAGRLGTVRFEISCGSSAQAPFNRAVALLHSFWYDEAERAFAEIAKNDPACGMAHWGMAMSNYHPIWAPPTGAELKRGSEAAQKALAAGAKTEREKDYIAAIAKFYEGAGKLDHKTRAAAYQEAMREVHRKHAADSEAAVFYALALLGTASPADKQYRNQKQAAAILNQVLPQHPDHPGVAHYVIHSFDYPQLAELALPAARSYAKIAPDSPHAIHMPSHIFTRLGLWEESIQSNIASARSAKTHVQRAKPGAGSFDQLHAMDYLVYAYLQQGREQKAKQVLEETRAIRALDQENFAAAYALAAVPARYALERRQWSEAAALKLEPSGFAWQAFPFAEAIVVFARGLGAARNGDTAAARQQTDRLAAIQQQLRGAPGYDWASQAEVQRRAVAAWLALAEGKREEVAGLMRSAADLEDATDKHPVTPGAVAPARELLGEMLLELKRPAEALIAFEAVLQEAPNRRNGLLGASRAARAAGQEEKARLYSSKL
ncbi:MAG: hypothetical protein FJW37_13625 [Acidobacteria bacterium]|nr:hypothetical protein [Acidobacteriota bacterium]